MTDTTTGKIRVHIIKPNGTRFESLWGENTPDNKILSGLKATKAIYGYNSTKAKTDPITRKEIQVQDDKSGFAYDNEKTIVAIVDEEGNEIRRLKGVSPNETPASQPVNTPQSKTDG